MNLQLLIAILLLPILVSLPKSSSHSELRNKANPSLNIKLPFYEPKTCGEFTFPQEIGNGWTKLGEYPWVVAIANFYPATLHIRIGCSGVLISMRHVLTQGACVTGTETTLPQFVRIGDWNISAKIDCENHICSDQKQDIPIAKIFTKYDPNVVWIDNIGLIKLLHSVQFTRYVAPICLPNPQTNPYVIGSQFVACGWSKSTNAKNDLTSEIKRKRLVTIDDDEICENFPFYHSSYDRSKHFCTSKSFVCIGDGPVMGIDDTSDPNISYWYISGFFLFTHQCKEAPTTFVKVLPYLEWIQAKMLID